MSLELVEKAFGYLRGFGNSQAYYIGLGQDGIRLFGIVGHLTHGSSARKGV